MRLSKHCRETSCAKAATDFPPPNLSKKLAKGSSIQNDGPSLDVVSSLMSVSRYDILQKDWVRANYVSWSLSGALDVMHIIRIYLELQLDDVNCFI